MGELKQKPQRRNLEDEVQAEEIKEADFCSWCHESRDELFEMYQSLAYHAGCLPEVKGDVEPLRKKQLYELLKRTSLNTADFAKRNKAKLKIKKAEIKAKRITERRERKKKRKEDRIEDSKRRPARRKKARDFVKKYNDLMDSVKDCGKLYDSIDLVFDVQLEFEGAKIETETELYGFKRSIKLFFDTGNSKSAFPVVTYSYNDNLLGTYVESLLMSMLFPIYLYYVASETLDGSLVFTQHLKYLKGLFTLENEELKFNNSCPVAFISINGDKLNKAFDYTVKLRDELYSKLSELNELAKKYPDIKELDAKLHDLGYKKEYCHLLE